MIRRILQGPDRGEDQSGITEDISGDPNADPVDLQIIGQEMVPVGGYGKGKGYGQTESSSTSAELVPATPTRPTTRLPIPAAEEQSAVEDRNVEVVAQRGFETPIGLQFPMGPPQVYGPTPHQQTPGQENPPLFDAEQLQRLSALQQQAQWIYGAPRGFGSFVPFVPRPGALMDEEEKLAERRLKALQEEQNQRLKQFQDLEFQVHQMKQEVSQLRTENVQYRAANEGIRLENQELRRLVAQKEDPRFDTPQEAEREVEQVKSEAEQPREIPEENPPRAASSDESSEKTAFQVMVKLMEGMQEIHKSMLKKGSEGEKGDFEAVRSGQVELPSLPEWSAVNGPIDLSDWLVLIEPIMSDLSNTSGEW